MSEKLIGKSLDGRYVLEEVLGTGATGAVFRAKQTAVDRLVAIKTLHPFLQDREDFQQRFEIEAKAIARLNHPNCITLYDFGYDNAIDAFYMAVEYIRGTSLAELMNRPVDFDDVMSISYQIAEALEHAHREGILHRDLKPENIMIQRSPNSGRPVVKVLDFGLARLYETEIKGGVEAPTGRYKQITQAGQVYGTPAYMSPEQCRSRDELTPATDLYSLGTLMYELLEGQLPFFSQSTAELILMQMTEEPPRMTRPDISEDMKDLIQRMMAKDPGVRPSSAKEVLLQLLPYVRLDASQEMRLTPSESGEYRAIPTGEYRAFRTGEFRAPTPTLTSQVPAPTTADLSFDEIRVAKSNRRGLIAAAIAALLLGFVGAMVVFALQEDDEVQAAEATVVDVAPSDESDSARAGDSIAQVAEEENEQSAGQPVENAEEESPAAKQPRAPKPRKPAASGDQQQSEQKESSDGRAKTLKLTY